MNFFKNVPAHLKEFAETDDDRAVILVSIDVVVVVVRVSLLRVVRAHVVNDGA